MVHLIQNRDDLKQKIREAGNKLIVIDFFATWCAPCTLVAPTLEQLAAKYTDEAVVLKVDVDACEDIAMEYDISGMPTFAFIKNKRVIDLLVGGNVEKLIQVFQKCILPEEEGKPESADSKQTGDNKKEADSQAQAVLDATQETTQEIAPENTQDLTEKIAQ